MHTENKIQICVISAQSLLNTVSPFV